MQAGRSNRYSKTDISNNICLLERDRTVCIKNSSTEGKNILTRFFLSDIYFYVLAAYLLSLSSPMRNKKRPVLLVDLFLFNSITTIFSKGEKNLSFYFPLLVFEIKK